MRDEGELRKTAKGATRKLLEENAKAWTRLDEKGSAMIDALASLPFRTKYSFRYHHVLCDRSWIMR